MVIKSPALLLLFPATIAGFGLVPDLTHVPVLENAFHSVQTTALPLISSYQEALRTDALRTQVATGVVLAVAGDAVAQQSTDEDYDAKRAVSFATFDGVYRAAQHVIYPPMIALCQGHVLGTVLSDVKLAAAVEQALVSQLLIIPVIYYPLFFAVTGLVQGLTAQQTFGRATSSFWSLMTRNWLFWIPVQFGVFAGVPDESAQISILIACGLVWTVILSVIAGEAKEEQPSLPLPELEMERVALQQASLSPLMGDEATAKAREPAYSEAVSRSK